MTQPIRKTRGAPRNTTIYTEGVDPLVVQLRTEQVRQGLSDYALAQITGLTPVRLAGMWRGRGPTLKALRTIEAALRHTNPAFRLGA